MENAPQPAVSLNQLIESVSEKVARKEIEEEKMGDESAEVTQKILEHTKKIYQLHFVALTGVLRDIIETEQRVWKNVIEAELEALSQLKDSPNFESVMKEREALITERMTNRKAALFRSTIDRLMSNKVPSAEAELMAKIIEADALASYSRFNLE